MKKNIFTQLLCLLICIASAPAFSQSIQLGASDLTDVYIDNLYIGFDPSATFGFDAFDTPKLLNSAPEIPNFYSTIGTGIDPYMFMGLPVVSDTTFYLTLGYMSYVSSNQHIRTIDQQNFPAGATVTLIDSLLHVHTDMLAANADYTFYMTSNYCIGCNAQWIGRFYLKFYFPSTNPSATSIHTLAPQSAPFCAGETVQVPFSITGTFNSGNVFTAQLSDANGNFSSPVNIGTLTSTNAGTINTTIPLATAPGSNYRIRVISSDPVTNGYPYTSSISIGTIPNIIYSGSIPSQCANSQPVNLFNYGIISPSGGHFSGTGVVNDYFYPAVAGTAGSPYTITYTYSDFAGCADASTNTIAVNGTPNVSFTGTLQSQCNNSSAYDLTDDAVISPAGGYFAGPGVTGTNFNAVASGYTSGSVNIMYIYSDANGCSDTATNTISVNQLPTPVITNLNSLYCLYNVDILMYGSPAGGSYSGTGVTGSIFSPSLAGVGTHTITYSYTDGNNCTGVYSIDVQVDACTEINEPENNGSISLYPNPANDILNISALCTEECQIKIYNAFGKVVFSGLINPAPDIQINITTLSKGIYYLLINNDNYSQAAKFYKE